MNHKAQAAVEYLSTFLWTGLAIIALIGALTYFNVFDLSRYEETTCQLGSQIVCIDTASYTDGFFALKVRNDIPHVIGLQRIELQYGDLDPIVQELDDMVVRTGEEATIIVYSEEPVDIKDKEKTTFNVVYDTELDGRELTVSGYADIAVSEYKSPYVAPGCNNNIVEPQIGEVCDPAGSICSPSGSSIRRCSADCTACVERSRCPQGEPNCGRFQYE